MARTALEIYHDQTIVVENLLGHHPEFDPATDSDFSDAERDAFRKVFLPDYNQFSDDYRLVYRHYHEREPETWRLAQATLAKFFQLHGVEGKDLLIEAN